MTIAGSSVCAQVDGDWPESGVADDLQVAEGVQGTAEPSDRVRMLVDDQDLEVFGHAATTFVCTRSSPRGGHDPAGRDPTFALVRQLDLEPVGALADDLQLGAVLDLSMTLEAIDGPLRTFAASTATMARFSGSDVTSVMPTPVWTIVLGSLTSAAQKLVVLKSWVILIVAGDGRRGAGREVAAQAPAVRQLGRVQAGGADRDAPLARVGGVLLGEVGLALDVREAGLRTHRLERLVRRVASR